MSKYRIVYRPNAGSYCYFAQQKSLFRWTDLPQKSFASYGIIEACETPSHSREMVERYIEQILLKQKDIVVKVYE